jgi:6-phosphogluconate dehydrogenase
MQIGMIGLGRMGANMVRRLMRAGHEGVVFDVSPDAVSELAGEGATGASSLEELVELLQPPRCICVMVPAAFVDDTVARLAPLLQADDTVIDGGNSYYRDDLRRARLAARGRRRPPRRATCTAARSARGTSSRWSTTGSSTG